MAKDDTKISESLKDNNDRTRLAPQKTAAPDAKHRTGGGRSDGKKPRKSRLPAIPKDEDATRALPGGKNVSSSQQLQKKPSVSTGQRLNNQAGTQYTEYNTSGKHGSSKGFEKAKEIARKALTGKGNILKKRFVLEQILGEGGMGVVYKARDLRKVEAEDPYPFVAAKVLSQGFKDHPDAFVVLQQEAAKSQRLAHPNIVTVHDFDRDGNTIYMTMELLQGKPLDKMIQTNGNKGIPKEQVFPLFADMCAALSYAHERQLIHADFKPGNVFVSDEGTAKVLDFGIARAASKESQKHNYDVGTLGAITPAYATIEMVQGIAPTFSDDVYALACVLYEMLAGRHPYQRQSAEAALAENIKPKRIESLNAKEWNALCQGMALRRKDRFSTADEFLKAIVPRKLSRAVKMAAVVVIVALCGVAWLGYKQHQAKQELRMTVADRLAAAQACVDNLDYDCVIEQSLVVINLAPDNQLAQRIHADATRELQEAQYAAKVSRLLSQARACFDQKDYACAKVKTDELLIIEPGNTNAETLQTQVAQAVHTRLVADVVSQGEECIAQKDLDCAVLFYNKAQKLDTDHELVKAYGEDLKTFHRQLKTASLNRKKTIDTYIAKAKACRSQGNYDCAIKHANSALNLDAKNIEAIRIKSEAELSRKQLQANKKKVALFVKQGQECFAKGNFNCAISKAQSALDVLPQSDDAQLLKKAAIDKQNELKRSLKIQ